MYCLKCNRWGQLGTRLREVALSGSESRRGVGTINMECINVQGAKIAQGVGKMTGLSSSNATIAWSRAIASMHRFSMTIP